MAADDDKVSPEREQTDESLRAEREKTDRALRERQEVLEQDADAVVERARENADAVLTAARDHADQQLDRAAPCAAPSSTIIEERIVEDAALRDERAAADESLRREREEAARVLRRLLPLERDATDRYLLTERNRSDDALMNRDDFLGIVAHDLRDLLSGIVMSAGLIAKHAPAIADSDKTLTETARIQRYAARMNRLVGDLVDVASIDAGKLAVTPVHADSAALIPESVDMFRAAACAKGITLAAEPVAGPLWAEHDHDRMLQVFANVITNAIKFSAAGSRIEVRGERAAGEVRFCIGDEGAGIPGDQLQAIFERFWQVGKNDRRGLGLGLYISRCIVEAHGGSIWAESVPGAGSRIYFTLPERFGRSG
ncbi:MAG: ATP-binding protein [Burkholderiales bacterium]